MHIELCPRAYASGLMSRDLMSRDLKSTAESFKSWGTCMDNKTCKIIAIVGIAIGALLVLWMLATFIQCLCMGVSCLNALCCCCCRRAHSNRYVEPPQQPYNNPNMYPQQVPMRQLEQTYQPVPHYAANPINYEENRYKRDNYEYSGYKPSQF